jgi:hypothetical protein
MVIEFFSYHLATIIYGLISLSLIEVPIALFLTGAKEARPDRIKMSYIPDDCAKTPLNVSNSLIFLRKIGKASI